MVTASVVGVRGGGGGAGGGEGREEEKGVQQL